MWGNKVQAKSDLIAVVILWAFFSSFISSLLSSSLLLCVPMGGCLDLVEPGLVPWANMHVLGSPTSCCLAA